MSNANKKNPKAGKGFFKSLFQDEESTDPHSDIDVPDYQPAELQDGDTAKPDASTVAPSTPASSTSAPGAAAADAPVASTPKPAERKPAAPDSAASDSAASDSAASDSVASDSSVSKASASDDSRPRLSFSDANSAHTPSSPTGSAQRPGKAADRDLPEATSTKDAAGGAEEPARGTERRDIYALAGRARPQKIAPAAPPAAAEAAAPVASGGADAPDIPDMPDTPREAREARRGEAETITGTIAEPASSGSAETPDTRAGAAPAAAAKAPGAKEAAGAHGQSAALDSTSPARSAGADPHHTRNTAAASAAAGAAGTAAGAAAAGAVVGSHPTESQPASQPDAADAGVAEHPYRGAAATPEDRPYRTAKAEGAGAVGMASGEKLEDPEDTEPGATQAEEADKPADPRRGTQSLGLFVLRVGVGVMLLVSGLQTLFGFGGDPGISGMETRLSAYHGASILAAALPITSVLAGGLLVLGLLTPLGAALGFIVAAFWALVHLNTNMGSLLPYGLNPVIHVWLLYCLSTLALVFTGPGAAALDRSRSWTRRPLASAWIFAVVAVGGAIGLWLLAGGGNPLN